MWNFYFVAVELGNYMIRLWEGCITAGCPVTLWLNNRARSDSVVEDFFRTFDSLHWGLNLVPGRCVLMYDDVHLICPHKAAG